MSNKITKSQVERELKKIASGKENHRALSRYIKPDYLGPECIVGHWLVFYAGISLTLLDGNYYDAKGTVNKLGLDLTSGARKYLNCVQRAQDGRVNYHIPGDSEIFFSYGRKNKGKHKMTWKEALEFADNRWKLELL